MRYPTCLAAALIAALLPVSPASAEWQETRNGDWRGAYACEPGGDTCVAITCQPGEDAKFGIWSKQFASLDQGEMRRERQFDVTIDGAAWSLPVDGGEYQPDKRVIFWAMDRGLLADVEDGRTASIRHWGDPHIDLGDQDGVLARTVEGCSFAVRTSVEAASVDSRSASGGSLWSSATDASQQAAMLQDLMPQDAVCKRSGDDASCRIGERTDTDLNSISAGFEGRTGDVTIRAEIAHRIGDHEGYRNRLYRTVAAFGIPQTFADDCLLKGAVTLDLSGYRVDCDSNLPSESTIATFHIVPR
ncbi:hypothetical protein [Aurantimonas sp. VKM B-3413]|uniref:hypothetical protein n=1 Tax=Aurantimonas sp. VKM B-3413 TaxID=2779401 RepID=UPI001E2DB454|nr:hypothetical protein [Aurantimonas sp. VKM B-3413]MCB8837985.1 hypothetical protein [Aurantimonas sp. VKM B-3413]